MQVFQRIAKPFRVALRKESVDRNHYDGTISDTYPGSLSARRAWIEIGINPDQSGKTDGRSPQGERG